MNRKIAMFGGSFNPVHNAHTNFANKVIKAFNLDKLYIVPTYSSPHKTGESMAEPADRLKMCEMAFKDIGKIIVSDIEIKRSGKSFTCDTLKQLKGLYPDDNLYLVMGADMYVTLPQWKNPLEIFKFAEIITFPRDNDGYQVLKDYSEKFKSLGAVTHILNEPVFMLSSTEIRNNIHNKEFAEKNLNLNVYKYILNNKLYGVKSYEL